MNAQTETERLDAVVDRIVDDAALAARLKAALRAARDVPRAPADEAASCLEEGGAELWDDVPV